MSAKELLRRRETSFTDTSSSLNTSSSTQRPSSLFEFSTTRKSSLSLLGSVPPVCQGRLLDTDFCRLVSPRRARRSLCHQRRSSNFPLRVPPFLLSSLPAFLLFLSSSYPLLVSSSPSPPSLLTISPFPIAVQLSLPSLFSFFSQWSCRADGHRACSSSWVQGHCLRWNRRESEDSGGHFQGRTRFQLQGASLSFQRLRQGLSRKNQETDSLE